MRETPSSLNVRLSDIAGVLVTVGQATMALSLPVAVASDQSAIPVSGTVTLGTSTVSVTGTISGTVTVATGTINVVNTVTVTPAAAFTVVQGTAANLNGTMILAAGTAVAGTVVVGAGTAAMGTLVVSTGNVAVTNTVTVTGTVTATPTGTYTVAGTVSAIQVGTTWTVAQGTAANLNVTVGTGTINAIQVGSTWTVAQGTASNLNATVSGTVTATPTGTQTVSGTVTATPTGTYTVSGTVTATPTGTYTISGGVNTKTALTLSAPTQTVLATASATVVASNGNRRGLVLVNVSTTSMSFAAGTTALLNNGITLPPFGVWEMDEYTYSIAQVNGIAATTSSAVAVQELVA